MLPEVQPMPALQHPYSSATRILLLMWLAGCNPDAGLKVYNTPPEVAILAPADGSTVAAGFPVRFEASVRDGQTPLEDLSLQFSLDDGSLLNGELSYTESGVVLEAASLPTGDRTVTLTAIDGSGESGKDTVGLTVREDEAPTVVFVAPTEGETLAAEDPVRVEVQAADADEALLSDLLLSWGDAAAGASAPAHPDSSGSAAFYLTELPVGSNIL